MRNGTFKEVNYKIGQFYEKGTFIFFLCNTVSTADPITKSLSNLACLYYNQNTICYHSYQLS